MASQMKPFLPSQMWPFLLHILLLSFTEAEAYWRWLAFASSKCLPDQTPLWINMDETSVATYFESGKGAVLTENTPGALKKSLGVKATLSDLRGAVTHIGMICSNTAIQPHLPQVIIGNKVQFTKKLLSKVASDKPATVHLLARKSAWNNADIMVDVFRLLAKALEPFAEQYLPIVLLDCATCHLSLEVLREARKLRLLLVFVPASCTQFLQPLDARAFAGYKAFLRREFARLQHQTSDGKVSRDLWLRLLMRAATSHLRSLPWRDAFTSCGAGAATRQQLSSGLRRRIPDAQFPESFIGPPTADQLAVLFPTNKRPALSEILSLDVPRRRLRRKTAST